MLRDTTMKTFLFILLLPALLLAAEPRGVLPPVESRLRDRDVTPRGEPTLAELQLQLEVIDAQQKHAAEAIERGKSQIEAGTLRGGLATSWRRELEAKRAEIEAKIKKLQEAEKK